MKTLVRIGSCLLLLGCGRDINPDFSLKYVIIEYHSNFDKARTLEHKPHLLDFYFYIKNRQDTAIELSFSEKEFGRFYISGDMGEKIPLKPNIQKIITPAQGKAVLVCPFPYDRFGEIKSLIKGKKVGEVSGKLLDSQILFVSRNGQKNPKEVKKNSFRVHVIFQDTLVTCFPNGNCQEFIDPALEGL